MHVCLVGPKKSTVFQKNNGSKFLLYVFGQKSYDLHNHAIRHHEHWLATQYCRPEHGCNIFFRMFLSIFLAKIQNGILHVKILCARFLYMATIAIDMHEDLQIGQF
jgi:hypothetical protein